MASDTAPAAAGTPNNTPEAPAHPTPAAGPGQATEQPQPGGFLAGLLAPVEPARTSADYHTETTPETAVSDATSADYHDTNNDSDTKAGNKQDSGKNSQQNGIIRAWMIAGAERWKKGGDARLVRAQMQKAKAAAQQTKETRTVTVNRSEGNVSAGSKGGGFGKSGGSSGNGAGKSLNSKSRTSNNGPGNTPKNTSPHGPGPGRTHSSKNNPGSGHGDGAGHRGGGGGNGGRGASGDRGSNRHAKDPQPKTPKTPAPARDAKTPSPGKGPKEPKAPKSPKPTKADASGASPRGSHTPKQGGDGKAGAHGPAGAPGGASNGSKASKHDRSPAPTPAPKSGDKPSTSGTDDRTAPSPRQHISLTKPNRKQKKPTPASPDDASKDSPKTTKPDATEKPESKKASSDAKPRTPDAPASRAGGKRLDVRESREAGYRDGVRYGTVTAHMSAYRDGWNDGRTDTRQAAAQEKKRLDTARGERKKQPERPPAKPIPPKPTQPPTTPAPAATADKPRIDLTKHKPDERNPMTTPLEPPTPGAGEQPQPLTVRGVDADAVYVDRNTEFPTGAGHTPSHRMTRGEVRNLAGLQQKLSTKAETTRAAAERTRALHAAAVEQSKAITRALEQSRGVKNGDRVLANLARLQESSKAQENEALENVKRAAKAAEAAPVVASNVEVRYGGIYQAVVDSPEKIPAELAYYQDLGVTPSV
ncbi:hypothetical protein [Streptomyces sp. NEAU-H3]|uniref:hypothetical protein n=1 Tax=Streptomyces sp. NEAU-H3 TaxID=2720636 RepID=UPI00143A5100|nr:hypothetical protein [Streptomyces sp. NEAU-H3]NJA59181.1 hypothetical protein [Streptomyces sp. NEAU-H3]